MRVLIYGNRKQDDDIYDISTPEKEAAAFLTLFNYLNDEWCVYGDDLGNKEQSLYDAAKRGDAMAAKKLLSIRRDYEYEEWHYGEVINPLEK